MLKKAIVSMLLLSVSCLSHAGLISADFITESHLPENTRLGAKTYQSLSQVIGAGVELSGEHLVSNPAGWGGGSVWMDFDPLNNVLTLLSQDEWDFQTFDAWMSNITFSQAGEYITGFSLLSSDLVTDNILPVLSFTADSLHISYKGIPDFNFTGGQAKFLVQTSQQPTSVPEPASVAIFGLALLGLGVGRRLSRRK